LTTIAVVLSSFHIYTAGFGLLVEIKHRAFHLALVLGLIFLVFPRPRPARNTKGIATEWSWALSFRGVSTSISPGTWLQRLSATGELQQGWAFLALVAFLAADHASGEAVRRLRRQAGVDRLAARAVRRRGLALT